MRIFCILLRDLKNFKKLIKNLNLKTLPLFFKEPILMRRLIIHLSGQFYVENKTLYFKLPNSMTFKIKNTGIIDTINEIFFFNNYTFHSADEYTVIDIGMNTGVASIFFSSFSNIKKVYAFEPFKKTFEYALENFKLNINTEKIAPFNYGISDKNESVSANCGGLASPGATITPAYTKSSEIINVKSIEYIFDVILKNNNNKILLKMDCEGSEYEIFKIMNAKNYLADITIIMLEYHKGEQELLEILDKHGFTSLLTGKKSCDSGMLYAFKGIK